MSTFGFAAMPFCADSDGPVDMMMTKSAMVDAAAASAAGSRATANDYARSGSSVMPVPSARMPKPNQIQSTSGLTKNSSVAV